MTGGEGAYKFWEIHTEVSIHETDGYALADELNPPARLARHPPPLIATPFIHNP